MKRLKPSAGRPAHSKEVSDESIEDSPKQTNKSGNMENEFIVIKTGDRGISIMVAEMGWWETATPASTRVHLTNGEVMEVNLAYDAFNQSVSNAGKEQPQVPAQQSAASHTKSHSRN